MDYLFPNYITYVYYFNLKKERLEMLNRMNKRRMNNVWLWDIQFRRFILRSVYADCDCGRTCDCVVFKETL